MSAQLKITFSMSWESYRDNVLQGEISEHLMPYFRQAFYAGACSYKGLWEGVLAKLPRDLRYELARELDKELDAFSKDLRETYGIRTQLEVRRVDHE